MSPRKPHHCRAFLLQAAACLAVLGGRDALAEAWTPDSDPFRLSSAYTYSFSDLPLAAELPAHLKPWSGPYWSTDQGGIAYRWRSGAKPGEYSPPTLEALKSMGPIELAALSPAEKLDALRGDAAYPTVAEWKKRMDDRGVRGWWGLCNGWSQASAQLAEPRSTVISGANGIRIPFSSADLKAIASWYYEDPNGGKDDHDLNTRSIGNRCDAKDARAYCGRDLNAGALHIAVANQIAVLGEAVFADVSRRKQLWHHPIYGYTARILGERAPHARAARGTAREVHVRLELRMTDYAPAEDGPTGLRTRTRVLRYWLELDPAGMVVGGSWPALGAGRALDYLWVSEPLELGRGYEILAPGLQKRPDPATSS